MSAEHHHADAHGHDHGHGGASHGTFGSYMIGFVLSVILTAIPFWLVMTGVIGSKVTTGYVIMAFALVQVVVHMVYFLHLSTKSENGWNMMALIFTAVVVIIALGGSFWVMDHMNMNMVPGMSTGDTGGL